MLREHQGQWGSKKGELAEIGGIWVLGLEFITLGGSWGRSGGEGISNTLLYIDEEFTRKRKRTR